MVKNKIIGLICLMFFFTSCTPHSEAKATSQLNSGEIEQSSTVESVEESRLPNASAQESDTESIRHSIDMSEQVESAEQIFGNGFVMKYKKVYQFSSEGGFIKAFYNNDELFYMMVDIYGEMGKVQYEYFFEDSKNIIIKRVINYTKPMYIEDFEIKEVLVEKYFYSEDIVYDLSSQQEGVTVASEKRTEIIEKIDEFIKIIENEED